MLRFLDDTDLVEQERDHLHNLLFNRSRKPACVVNNLKMFPFEVDTVALLRAEEEAACSSSSRGGCHSSVESLQGGTQSSFPSDSHDSPTYSYASSGQITRQTSVNSGNKEQQRLPPVATTQYMPNNGVPLFVAPVPLSHPHTVGLVQMPMTSYIGPMYYNTGTNYVLPTLISRGGTSPNVHGTMMPPSHFGYYPHLFSPRMMSATAFCQQMPNVETLMNAPSNLPPVSASQQHQHHHQLPPQIPQQHEIDVTLPKADDRPVEHYRDNCLATSDVYEVVNDDSNFSHQTNDSTVKTDQKLPTLAPSASSTNLDDHLPSTTSAEIERHSPNQRNASHIVNTDCAMPTLATTKSTAAVLAGGNTATLSDNPASVPMNDKLDTVVETTPAVAVSPDEASSTGNSTSASATDIANVVTAPKQKTWASLFENTKTANSALIYTTTVPGDGRENVRNDGYTKSHSDRTRDDGDQPRSVDGSSSDNNLTLSDPSKDPRAHALSEALRSCKFVDRGPTYMLRGIVNRGNWCYVNSVLQALMACPPFYHFLRQLDQVVHRTPSSTPLLDAFVKLSMEFPLLNMMKTAQYRASDTGPIDPVYLRNIFGQMKSDASFKGRQEDAEELLLLALNGLHEEMVSTISAFHKENKTEATDRDFVNGDATNEDPDSSEWHQVGPGRKSALTRQTKYSQSPISQLFLGQLRYGLIQAGKESANLEPFYTLPLDVQPSNVKDIASALQSFTSKEVLKSFVGKNKTEIDATRRVTFLELPRVLILQLKYFIYTEEGMKKIMKPIDYTMELNIERDLLHMRGKSFSSFRPYKLFAVIFHHGEKAEGGHYTVDVFHGGQWMHVDDTKITPVENDHVLHHQAGRAPYLLFYRRLEPKTDPPHHYYNYQQSHSSNVHRREV